MGSSFSISPSFGALGISLKAPTREGDLCFLRSKRSVIYCQSNGGTKAIRSIRVSSALTERSALVSEAHSTSAVIEAGSLVLSPNGKGHPEAAVKEIVPYSAPTTSPPLVDVQDGIGIVRFLKGKVFFVTGATGFLAKVLIEKILRTMPDVGKIYVLIKAKNKEAAMGRLKNEIINSDLFNCLRQTYGKSYRSFMLSKLVPIVGNVCETNLGMEEELVNGIVDEIDVIVNSAANTTFDERYDIAVDINTRGPRHVLGFARKCQNLKLFLQVSTAYVNGQRQGRILEKPFSIGDCIASENLNRGSKTRILSTLDVEYEMNLALESQKVFEENEEGQKLKELGLKRAKKYGWQDTYVFTKAMGEMMIDSLRGDIPVVIIRPSVIESTWKEPFPGWMEGNRMMDPIILYYGKGQLTGFFVDPNGVLDVVPADMVVNATLAALAKHGNAQKSGVHVYQVASSTVNPLVFKDLADMLYQHYNSKPHIDSKGRPIAVSSMKFFDSMEDFSSNIWIDVINRIGLPEIASLNGKLSWKHEFLCRKSVEQAKHLANIYEPYTFYGGRFDNSNTRRLFESMSENEKREFGFDVGNIDWRDYITNIHIPGLRRHVMKGRGMCG